jgi:hypothetical protein
MANVLGALLLRLRHSSMRFGGGRILVSVACAAAFVCLCATPAGAADPATGRKLLFEDNFYGTKLNTASWSTYNGPGYNGHGLRRPYQVKPDGHGNLVISAQMINGKVISGGMTNRLNRAYGLYEFRVRVEPDPTHNMSGAVLTWPQSGRWPQDGENDIYETGTYNPRKPFFSFIHFGNTASTQHS